MLMSESNFCRTQTFSPHSVANDIRSKSNFQGWFTSDGVCADDFFLFVTVMYVVDIHVRFYGLGWRSFRANGWNMFDIVVSSGSLLTNISVRLGVTGVIDQLQKLFLVSIAFKLVQRTNNLNKLFKTALYVESHRET
jgi:ion transport protein